MSSTRAHCPRSATLLLTSLLLIPCSAARATTVLSGAVRCDTLDAGTDLVRRAVMEAMGERRWTLDPATADRDTLETAWQPIRSLAVRLMVGNVKAHCRIALTPVGAGRTVVAFHAVAEAEQPIESAAVRHAGEKANDACARDWFLRLRRIVAGLQAAGADSASPVTLRSPS